MITLDILSDPICPWCYIGKTNFDRAVEAKGVQPFTISWKPFQLNPDMPKEGMEKEAYFARRFDGRDRNEIYKRIEELGASIGISFRFDLIKRIPNTQDAHRLIHWASTVDAQTPMVSQLFSRYFERGEDIGDRDVLLDAAVSIGLERDVMNQLFESDADLEALLAEEAHAREIGVSGVPTFIVAGRHVVVGAQAADVWENVLDELTPKASEIQ